MLIITFSLALKSVIGQVWEKERNHSLRVSSKVYFCFVNSYNFNVTFQSSVKDTGETFVDEAVLEGHLGIAKELLSFMSPEKKYELGSEEKKSINLVKVWFWF